MIATATLLADILGTADDIVSTLDELGHEIAQVTVRNQPGDGGFAAQVEVQLRAIAHQSALLDLLDVCLNCTKITGERYGSVVEARGVLVNGTTLKVYASNAAMLACDDIPCDGETHYTGRRDPETNEDIEAGPCPRWSDRGSAPVALALGACIVVGLLSLAAMVGGQ